MASLCFGTYSLLLRHSSYRSCPPESAAKTPRPLSPVLVEGADDQVCEREHEYSRQGGYRWDGYGCLDFIVLQCECTTTKTITNLGWQTQIGGANVEEYEIHLKGIHQMLKVRGGAENLGMRGMARNWLAICWGPWREGWEYGQFNWDNGLWVQCSVCSVDFPTADNYKVLIHSPTVFTSWAKSGQINSVAAFFCSMLNPAVASFSKVTW